MGRLLQILTVTIKTFLCAPWGLNLIILLRTCPVLVEILWGWALQGHSGAGHSRTTLGLQGDSGAGHCRGLGAPGHSDLGHSTETLGLGNFSETSTGTLSGWALQGDSGVGHSGNTLALGN